MAPDARTQLLLAHDERLGTADVEPHVEETRGGLVEEDRARTMKRVRAQLLTTRPSRREDRRRALDDLPHAATASDRGEARGQRDVRADEMRSQGQGTACG